MRSDERPLSPHLQIYRLSVLMVMSIMHRITGVALYGGMLIFTLWILALALGPGPYGLFQAFAQSVPGLVICFGLSWCFFHHMLGGVRHLIWDTVHCLEVKSARLLAWGNLLLSLTLTLGLWTLAFYSHGR